MAKKPFKLSFRWVLTFITIGLVIFAIYQNWNDIMEAVKHLPEANIFVLLLLIPEQLFMYYACGKIFFSYLGKKAATQKELARVSLELNFVNHAVPAGGFGGLAFLSWRLKRFGVSAGQASFLYIFRYALTTVINYFQALIAIIVLLVLHAIPDDAHWVIGVSLVMNVGVAVGLSLIIFVASGKKRIEFFARQVTRFANFVVKTITFGKKRQALDIQRVTHYLLDIHESILVAKKNKKGLIKPTIWGFVYSFCEIATYWIVAIALGRPELLPYIMIGEAIGSVFDGIVPYGLYELGMTGVMVALGIDIGTAGIVVVMTRVATLLFTIATGCWPYNQTIMKLGDKKSETELQEAEKKAEE